MKKECHNKEPYLTGFPVFRAKKEVHLSRGHIIKVYCLAQGLNKVLTESTHSTPNFLFGLKWNISLILFPSLYVFFILYLCLWLS